MARFAPLVGPRVTCGRGCGSHGLCLHYIASLGSDHGIHWSTGWGCKRLGGIRKHFRMTRVLPLLVSLPTAPPGCFDVGLSHLSALRGGCIAPPGGLFYIFEDNHLQKKNPFLKQHFHFVVVHGVEKTQPVEPVEPVVRCCKARTGARDALYDHGSATGQPVETSGVPLTATQSSIPADQWNPWWCPPPMCARTWPPSQTRNASTDRPTTLGTLLRWRHRRTSRRSCGHTLTRFN